MQAVIVDDGGCDSDNDNGDDGVGVSVGDCVGVVDCDGVKSCLGVSAYLVPQVTVYRRASRLRR